MGEAGLGTHLSLPKGSQGHLGTDGMTGLKKIAFFFYFWKVLGLNLGKFRDLTPEQNSSMFM